MNKFYFLHRNVGLNPDTTKYYFSTVEELISQVELLQNINTNHIRWSVSIWSDQVFALMSEFDDRRGLNWFGRICYYLFSSWGCFLVNL